MATMLEVCMYSGACSWDPRCEMTEEQTTILLNKVALLDTPPDPKAKRHWPLGKDCFSVCPNVKEIRKDGFEFETPTVDWYVQCYPGRITWYKAGQTDTVEYLDTQGIVEFLSEIAQPAIQEHLADGEKSLKENFGAILDIDPNLIDITGIFDVKK